MISVGVHEFRNRLSRYLRLAQDGQCVLVTNRSQPVALLKKPDMDSVQTTEERLAAMTAAGKLIPAIEPGPSKPFKPRKLRGKPFSQSIIEDRR